MSFSRPGLVGAPMSNVDRDKPIGSIRTDAPTNTQRYLLFCWAFVPAIIGFVKDILLLVMSDSDFNKKYGSA